MICNIRKSECLRLTQIKRNNNQAPTPNQSRGCLLFYKDELYLLGKRYRTGMASNAQILDDI